MQRRILRPILFGLLGVLALGGCDPAATRPATDTAPAADVESILSVGMQWASRVTTVGLEFALPPLLGVWLDRWWGTTPWATVVGAVLGFAVGMMHILRIAREAPGSK